MRWKKCCPSPQAPLRGCNGLNQLSCNNTGKFIGCFMNKVMTIGNGHLDFSPAPQSFKPIVMRQKTWDILFLEACKSFVQKSSQSSLHTQWCGGQVSFTMRMADHLPSLGYSLAHSPTWPPGHILRKVIPETSTVRASRAPWVPVEREAHSRPAWPGGYSPEAWAGEGRGDI